MRAPFVLICSFALVCAVRGETEHKKETSHAKKPSGSAPVQHPQAPQRTGKGGGGHPGTGGGHPGTGGRGHPGAGGGAVIKPTGPESHLETAPGGKLAAPPLTKEQQAEVNAQDHGFRSAEQYRKWKETGRVETSGSVATSRAPVREQGATAAGSGVASSHTGVHPFPSRHFDLPNAPVSGIQHVKFQPDSHIPESEKWRDSRYNVFRNYTATWHHADWWRSHHSRIVFVLGGWYYWHANYWYPAWGYQPEAVYAYDGPIYAYNDLAPDQAVANVQATLQQLRYYNGPINGYLDSATREAISNFQRDHGLYATSTIDEPTLASLGMA